MNESASKTHALWDSTASRNVLVPENLYLVRHELLDDGVVFGWHYYYGGGRSGDMFCFSDYESYYRQLNNSHPGDHFTVYSRNRLATKALCRLGDPKSDQPTLSARDLFEVKTAMAAGKELVFLWCHAQPETGVIECDTGILWDLTEEELEAALHLGSGRPGEFLFFPVQMLDEDQDGNPITSVSPGARKRANAVVDGKRPNDAGLTPASGPY